jgi:homeodomain-containing protein
VLRESQADREKFARTSLLRLEQQQVGLLAQLDREYEDRLADRIPEELWTAKSAELQRVRGDKVFDRYKDCGVQAFTDRSRRAYRQANRLPAPLDATIVRLKREYPDWGAPKIREKLRDQFTVPHLPAISTCTPCWTATTCRASASSPGTRRGHDAIGSLGSSYARRMASAKGNPRPPCCCAAAQRGRAVANIVQCGQVAVSY